MKHLSKLNKTILMLATLAIVFNSCISENLIPYTPIEVEGYKTISLHITQSPTTIRSLSGCNVKECESGIETRGVSHPISGELVQFNHGDLYLVNHLGFVVEHFRITPSGGTPTDIPAGIINRDEFNFNPAATDVLTLTNVRGNVTEVIIIGNTSYNATEGNVNVIGTRVLDIISQYCARTPGVNLFSQTLTPLTHVGGDLWETSLYLAPTVARFEIAEIVGMGNIAAFEVTGIFMNNFFSRAHINGNIITASLWNGGTDLDAFVSGQGYFTTNGALFDTPNLTGNHTNNRTVRPTGGGANDVWSYQVFAPTNPTTLTLAQQPHIVIRLSNVVLIGEDNPSPNDYLLVVNNFYQNGTPLNEDFRIRAGEVYRLERVVFSETDLVGFTPTLVVTPPALLFKQVAGGGGAQTVTVTTNMPTWTLTSDQTWVQVPEGVQTGSSFSVTVPTANTGAAPRTATLTVTAYGLTETVTVTQWNAVPLSGAFVGAFWRNNQRGERLIRIPHNTGQENATWTVFATEDWIQLDRELEWEMTGNEHLVCMTTQDHLHRLPAVTGGQISGTGNIYFRIGLDSYNTNPVNPRNRTPDNQDGREPRWGQVIVEHSQGTHIIWIRQGEDTAELMRVGDFPDANANVDRSAANAHRIRSFSPFNLTAQTLDMQVGTRAQQLDAGFGGNRSTFVQYPTQTGAFWQWGGNSVATQRMPWNPISPDTPSGWVNTSISGSWYTNATTPNLATNHETCPPGFRRPHDGTPWGRRISNSTVAAVQASEMRQSLFLMPPVGHSETHQTNRENAVFGFYADGFFDRRLPTNATGNPVSRATASTVAAGTIQIAHRGVVLFNTESQASIFFPHSGTLSAFGTPSLIGSHGGYWSTVWGSPSSTITAWAFRTSTTTVFICSHLTPRHRGFSIRCVAE